MVGIVEGIGVSIASGLAKDGIELAMKRMLTQTTNPKDPIIYFGLWCNFREMPLFDKARAALNEVINRLGRSGANLLQGKNTFDYDITWKTLEGCEIPREQWEYDALIEEEQKDLEEESANCVLGFTFWLWPRSMGERKDMIISAYHILSQVERRIRESGELPNMKTGNFAFVRSDKEMCQKILSRLSTRIDGKRETKGTLGIVDQASLPENMMLLTIPLHEFVVAKAFADSFSIWGSIGK